MESPEDVKQQLRQKLASIQSLQQEYEELKCKKQKIDQEIDPIKGYLENTLVDTQMRKLEWNEFQVERVAKQQQRRPTLKITYQAVKKVLGEQALQDVKNEITNLREDRKKKAIKKASLVIVKIGKLRKPRKDKLPPEQLKRNKKRQNTEDKPKKKLYTRRRKHTQQEE